MSDDFKPMPIFSFANSPDLKHDEESSAPAALPAGAAPAQTATESAAQPALEPNRDEPGEELPEEVRKVREERRAQGFNFSPQKVYEHAIPADGSSDASVRAAREWREIAADFQVPEPQAKDLYQVATGALADGVPTEDTVLRWERESRDWLNRTYGPDAPAVLAAAQRLIKRDPRLASYLTVTGLGNHVAFVRLAVEKARSGGR